MKSETINDKKLTALEKRRSKYNTNRAKIIEHFGGRCTRCSGAEQLEVRSIGKGSAHVSFNYYRECKWDTILSMIDKFTVECRSHRISPPEHGTMSMYNNYGCRCRPCKTSWAKYIQDRKVKAREIPNNLK